MKYTKEYLTELISQSICMWDVVEKAGMSKQEGNYFYLTKLIKKNNISTSHFEDQRKGQNKVEKPIEDYLINGKYLSISGNNLKNRLYKLGLKKPICEKCGQDENWRGDKISLILDHISGDREDNRIENLRIVCPNCNASLNTHCGKNKKVVRNNILIKRVPINLIDDKIKKIKDSGINFTKKGWRMEVANLLKCTPQYSGKLIKNYIPEVWDICYKHKLQGREEVIPQRS